jgi:large subunit ribosomal protein L35
MPKMKTHSGTAKRFLVTATGKIRRRKQGGNHLRRKKPKRTRRAYTRHVPVGGAEEKHIRQILSTG